MVSQWKVNRFYINKRWKEECFYNEGRWKRSEKLEAIWRETVQSILVTKIEITRQSPHLEGDSILFFNLGKGGRRKNVEKITNDDILAEIDYKTHYKPEQLEYPVSIKTPPEISWLECIPKTFKLTVKRK